jgi:uncharacterized membrane protein YGL010W
MTQEQLYTDYAGYHQDVRNRRIHAVGIPLIVLGLLGLLHAYPLLHFGPVDLAVAAAFAVLLYYLGLDASLGATSRTLIFRELFDSLTFSRRAT